MIIKGNWESDDRQLYLCIPKTVNLPEEITGKWPEYSVVQLRGLVSSKGFKLEEYLNNKLVNKT